MRATAQRLVRRASARSSARPSRKQLAAEVRRLEDRVATLERKLRRRVRELEEGVQEQRALSQRVAVLGDLVAEVLSAGARGDREDLEAALERYADGL